jgi:hypothetical protein
VAGSLLMGLAVVMFAMSLLRALQTETDGWLDGWWSWAPYVITLVFCALVILIAVSRMSAKKARSK